MPSARLWAFKYIDVKQWNTEEERNNIRFQVNLVLTGEQQRLIKMVEIEWEDTDPNGDFGAFFDGNLYYQDQRKERNKCEREWDKTPTFDWILWTIWMRAPFFLVWVIDARVMRCGGFKFMNPCDPSSFIFCI